MKYNTKIVLAYWKSEGIPKPEVEHKFSTLRNWRFDFCWYEYLTELSIEPGNAPMMPLIALEVEGGVWVAGRHTRGSGFVKDMEKYNEAAVLGWRIIRVQPDELLTLKTVKLIKLSLGL